MCDIYDLPVLIVNMETNEIFGKKEKKKAQLKAKLSRDEKNHNLKKKSFSENNLQISGKSFKRLKKFNFTQKNI